MSEENSDLIKANCPECDKKRNFEVDRLNREVRCIVCGYTMGWEDDEEIRRIANGDTK